MDKRSIRIGGYDTAAHGWTLTGWALSAPEQKTNYMEKTAGDGAWDLSTAMTDGIPRYKNRSLSATLECSQGTRADRLDLVSEMINQLDGLRWQIVLPDFPERYLEGRVHVAELYNDLAHASVSVTAVVDPWIYNAQETMITVTATSTEKTIRLTNAGRKVLVPILTVRGSVLLEYGAASLSMTDGDYEWPDLLLTPGDHTVTYSGDGTLVVTYREAVLR